MDCKICGKPLEDGAKICRNCGTSLAEMGLAPKKVELTKDDGHKNDFERKAQQFGGVYVKERKASMMAGVDMKILSMVLLISMLIIFLAAKTIFDRKMTHTSFDGFDITLPASLRRVDDDSFEVQRSLVCRSYANTEMEFTYVKYDANTMIPNLNMVPADNDIEELSAYYTAQNKLITLKDDFAKELDEAFEKDLKDYKRLRMENGQLDFTFNDNAMVNDYVEMRIIVKDDIVYQFSLLCSEERKDKLSDKFDKIMNSIDVK